MSIKQSNNKMSSNKCSGWNVITLNWMNQPTNQNTIKVPKVVDCKTLWTSVINIPMSAPSLVNNWHPTYLIFKLPCWSEDERPSRGFLGASRFRDLEAFRLGRTTSHVFMLVRRWMFSIVLLTKIYVISCYIQLSADIRMKKRKILSECLSVCTEGSWKPLNSYGYTYCEAFHRSREGL